MLEWIKAIAFLITAISLLVLAGCSLYLFGVPIVFYLIFSLGIAVGIIFMLNLFFVFCWKFFREYETDEDYEQYVESDIVSELKPQPELREAIEQQQCRLVVWRDIGRDDYLQEFDPDSLSAVFCSDLAQAKIFNSFSEASRHKDLIWMIYGCTYKFRIKILQTEDHEDLVETDQLTE